MWGVRWNFAFAIVWPFPVFMLEYFFFHFNQPNCSHGGRESKRVRESKNSTSLGVYVQRLIHSVSVLPFRSAHNGKRYFGGVCLARDTSTVHESQC